jgi:hypothetical protein
MTALDSSPGAAVPAVAANNCAKSAERLRRPRCWAIWSTVMTVDELLAREAIRDTLARYNSAGDRMLVDEYVAVFAPDATFEPGELTLHGRDEIRRWLTAGVQVGGAAPGSAPPEGDRGGRGHFVRHHLTTCRIDLDGPTEASVRTYFAVYTEIGPDHCGYYKDRFVKQGDEWLIAHRTVRIDWVTPDGFMAQ